MKKMAKSIGLNVQQPKKTCVDVHCPFHGTISVRGRQHVGTVISTKMRRSAVVEWERRLFLPKYERYEKRLTKITVHAPDCLEVKEGDLVRIGETRPLSKTKHYTIVENLGQQKGYVLKKEGREEGKMLKKELKKSEE